MTARGEMMRLAELCEAATGPDRELDARICITLGRSKSNVMVGENGWCINSDTNPNPYKSPAYTASIDAALTLKPKAYNLSVLLHDIAAELFERFRTDEEAKLKALPRVAAATCLKARALTDEGEA